MICELKNIAKYVNEKIKVDTINFNSYISTENMYPNKGGIEVAKELPKATSVTKYQNEDILVSNIRPYFKKIWYANRTGGCSNDVLVFRVNNVEQINSKYLYYVLSQDSFFDFMMSGSNGTKMPRGNKKLIPEFKLIEFSIDKQKRIANILSAYDDLTENNQKQIKLLEEAAMRLYKEWFINLRFPRYENTTIVDGLPEGWKKENLGFIAVDAGKIESKKNRNKYSCYIPIDCIPKKSLACVDFKNVDGAESSLVAFAENDILFGAMRPYFHKVMVAPSDGLTRTTCFVINSKEPYLWSYLLMLMFSEDTINYATQISVGTTMPYVRWKDMVNMPIIIPDRSTLVHFQDFCSPLIKQIQTLSKQINFAIIARDKLLPKLMSGEIEV